MSVVTMLKSKKNPEEVEYEFFDSLEPTPFFWLDKNRNKEANPGKVPMDGYEYINLVQHERRNTERSTYSSPPPPAKKPTPNKPKNSRDLTVEIRRFLTTLFYEKRYLVNLALLKFNYPLKTGESVPLIENMLGWCEFCLGEEQMKIMKTHADPKYIQSYQKQAFDPNGYEPYCRFVCPLKKEELSMLLNYTDMWLHHLGCSNRLCLWIYALLLVIEKPLSYEASNSMSYLVHTCITLRDSIENKSDVISLNLIICALRFYFEIKPKIRVVKSARKQKRMDREELDRKEKEIKTEQKTMEKNSEKKNLVKKMSDADKMRLISNYIEEKTKGSASEDSDSSNSND